MIIYEFILPKIGEGIIEATIVKWHKRMGEQVQEDEILLDIKTDKIDIDLTSPVTGEIVEILYEENSTVPMGDIIARIKIIDEEKL
jgi:2-oxoglutarate dehydrogenase E2 component (dihydrolipoamide succinyltransferase)